MTRIIALLLWWTVSVAAAQTQPPPQENVQQKAEELPWSIRLGLRSLQVSQAYPLVDRVVLVPDAATYVDELSKWSPAGGRWPVLLEDDFYAPMFVRRFEPAQLLRREPVNRSLPEDAVGKRRILEGVVVKAFEGDPATQQLKAVFASHNFKPQGVVIASTQDPAWTAAIALAAGRGQPIAWLDDDYGKPNDELDHPHALRLVRAVDDLVSSQGYSWEGLGDDIDTITICRDLAVRAAVNLPDVQRVSVPNLNTEGPVAVTDLLGRKADGSRYAITGWIFGDEIRSAYIAMCSLFLSPQRATLWNTYPTDGELASYGMSEAHLALAKRGFGSEQHSGSTANQLAWRRMITSGADFHLLLLNSRGGFDSFDLVDGPGYARDIPILHTPAAVHFIHSWSLQFPAKHETVGGRWLDRGAYALIGSSHEPYLGAFTPPIVLADRILHLVPLLVSARWWDGEGPFSKPWRIVTYGDPLMVCGPVEAMAKQRIAPQHLEADSGYLDLNAHVKGLMRQSQNDSRGETYAQAIAILNMLGKDGIARNLWIHANTNGKGHAAARAALPVLFRGRDVEQFMSAWNQLPKQDEVARDMLWHLIEPRIAGGPVSDDTKAMLMALQSAIRQPWPEVDLRRLCPHLARVLGKDHARGAIERELQRLPPQGDRPALLELLKQY